MRHQIMYGSLRVGVGRQVHSPNLDLSGAAAFWRGASPPAHTQAGAAVGGTPLAPARVLL